MLFKLYRWLPASLALPLLFGPPAWCNTVYTIDPSLATIGFSVRTFGIFETPGAFKRFTATFSLDFKAPENSAITVTIDAGSVTMSYQDAVEMLESSDFFDVAHHPTITFSSTSVQPVSPGHFNVLGNLQIRGITHPATLNAVLTSRSIDRGSGVEISDFAVSGTLDRTIYGMVAARDIVAKTVSLDIRVRISINAAARAG